MTTSVPLTMRPMKAEHVAFVAETWLKTYRYSDAARMIPTDVFWSSAGHRGVVDYLLIAATVDVYECAGTIAAWVCHGKGWLHYVYVAKEFRRFKIGATIVEDKPLPASHATRAYERLCRAIVREVRFDPYSYPRPRTMETQHEAQVG